MPERVSDEALQQICDRTLDDLYGYVSRRCGGQRELAEDIVQETWLRAVRTWRRNGPPANAVAWLNTVARNLLIDGLRREKIIAFEAVSSDDVLRAIEDNSYSESSEIATAVNQALARIPDAEAQLLEAFHFERFKVSQLATKYGISERAVEGRLRRAREHLRRELVHTQNVEGDRA